MNFEKDKNEIFVEFVVQRASVKVTAIDSKSGMEASIVGPANAPRATLESAATRKLAHILKRQAP